MFGMKLLYILRNPRKGRSSDLAPENSGFQKVLVVLFALKLKPE